VHLVKLMGPNPVPGGSQDYWHTWGVYIVVRPPSGKYVEHASDAFLLHDEYEVVR
jgi:hypothetical protein